MLLLNMDRSFKTVLKSAFVSIFLVLFVIKKTIDDLFFYNVIINSLKKQLGITK